MRTVVIGDVHGRSIWLDILNHEHPDKVVFLGDYVSSKEIISGDKQAEILCSILELKRNNPEEIILLRGNHDLEAMPYRWASCYPWAPLAVREKFNNEEFRNEFLELTQWVHVLQVGSKQAICSHAGVSKEWLQLLGGDGQFNEEFINSLPPSKLFGFNDEDWSGVGNNPKQPCTWLRPLALSTHFVDGYDQIVGHTQTAKGCVKINAGEEVDIFCCDALANRGYLVINGDKYEPKILK